MPLFELTPSWIMFDSFWHALHRRNRWLILLRWWAVGMLVAMVLGVELLAGLTIETFAVAGIAVVIALYNVVLARALPRVPAARARFHGLHFALVQIVADLLALMALIYVTGGVESPFYPFFIFHVIIGSLILPGSVVVLTIGIALTVMLAGAIGEAVGMLPHHAIAGLYSVPLHTQPVFITVHFLIFTVTLFVSTFLANSVSKELYQRERALTNAYTALEEAEQAKSRYVMSVVHDLKTPITAAITYLNMILDRNFGDVRTELEHPLERSRVRLSGAITTINDILQFTQLKLTSEITRIPVNVTRVIDDIIQEMQILFSAKKVRVSSWTNAAGDISCAGDHVLLRLALGNLVSNAHKYTPEGGAVEVHINVRGGEVTIEVADNGIGVAPDEQQKIFNDFYRSLDAKKRGIEGTGLGLSVVQYIVRQHKGSIRLESPSRLAAGDERPGSAFIITLPLEA